MDVVLGEIEDDAKDGGDMNVVEILGKLAHELKCRESVSRDCGPDTRGRTNLASPADVESLGVDPEENVLLSTRWSAGQLQCISGSLTHGDRDDWGGLFVVVFVEVRLLLLTLFALRLVIGSVWSLYTGW